MTFKERPQLSSKHPSRRDGTFLAQPHCHTYCSVCVGPAWPCGCRLSTPKWAPLGGEHGEGR